MQTNWAEAWLQFLFDQEDLRLQVHRPWRLRRSKYYKQCDA
jgi:hypothetical protein